MDLSTQSRQDLSLKKWLAALLCKWNEIALRTALHPSKPKGSSGSLCTQFHFSPNPTLKSHYHFGDCVLNFTWNRLVRPKAVWKSGARAGIKEKVISDAAPSLSALRTSVPDLTSDITAHLHSDY